MLELAEHILDIAENSIRAGATTVEIFINEDSAKDLLYIEIKDNGSGMTREEIGKVEDPFYTTKTVRRVGLGIPLLANATKTSGGNLSLKSTKGKGTKLKATFQQT
jgi:signal transduction histidine kinase